jgi:hypothetical protein
LLQEKGKDKFARPVSIFVTFDKISDSDRAEEIFTRGQVSLSHLSASDVFRRIKGTKPIKLLNHQVRLLPRSNPTDNSW